MEFLLPTLVIMMKSIHPGTFMLNVWLPSRGKVRGRLDLIWGALPAAVLGMKSTCCTSMNPGSSDLETLHS